MKGCVAMDQLSPVKRTHRRHAPPAVARGMIHGGVSNKTTTRGHIYLFVCFDILSRRFTVTDYYNSIRPSMVPRQMSDAAPHGSLESISNRLRFT